MVILNPGPTIPIWSPSTRVWISQRPWTCRHITWTSDYLKHGAIHVMICRPGRTIPCGLIRTVSFLLSRLLPCPTQSTRFTCRVWVPLGRTSLRIASGDGAGFSRARTGNFCCARRLTQPSLCSAPMPYGVRKKSTHSLIPAQLLQELQDQPVMSSLDDAQAPVLGSGSTGKRGRDDEDDQQHGMSLDIPAFFQNSTLTVA